MFFARLGEDFETMIVRRTDELADQEELTGRIGFTARCALLATLRHAAEQEVLAQMLLAALGTDDRACR